MKQKTTQHSIAVLLGVLIGLPLASLAQDWYEATGKPVQRSLLSSTDLRTEFASIESGISAKLPALAGNSGKLIAVNSGETALEAVSVGISIANGGTGATTAADARTSLGVDIGSDVQAFDPDLTTLADTSAVSNDRVLRKTSNAINYGQLTAGMFPNAVVPNAALQSSVAIASSGSFVATWTGFSSAPTGTIQWRLVNNMVTMWVEADVLGTSNNTTMIITNPPAAILPDNNRFVPCVLRDASGGDNGASMGAVIIEPGASRLLFLTLATSPPRALAGAAFTTFGSKGLPEGWTVSYALSN